MTSTISPAGFSKFYPNNSETALSGPVFSQQPRSSLIPKTPSKQASSPALEVHQASAGSGTKQAHPLWKLTYAIRTLILLRIRFRYHNTICTTFLAVYHS